MRTIWPAKRTKTTIDPLPPAPRSVGGGLAPRSSSTARTNTMLCRYCGDVLDDAPPGVDTCRKWCAWQARERGDMLTEVEAIRLQMFAFLCALDVAITQGLELLPELD